jgi:hypothetical protein
MPVQVRINTSLEDTIVTLFNNAQTQNFQFQVIGEPQSIVFDPGNWILKNNTTVTEVKDLTVPFVFSLEQNYPNPFNPSTTISYQVPEKEFVTLKVYNVLGKEVTTLVSEEKAVGKYEVKFDASSLTSGIYFYRLQAGSFVETKKMILIK